METIRKYLEEKDNSDSESIDFISFDKEKYTKFYELINNVILFFLLNTYETQINGIKDSVFDLDKINELICNYDYLETSLKAQLNIYWMEVHDKKIRDQLIIDLESIIDLNIIKHYYCLFTYIKNMALSIMKDTSRIKLENINDKKEYLEKIIKIAHAIMEINKVSGLEDEDEFECHNCKNVENNNTTFWN